MPSIKEAKQHALRNRYTLEVYEQTNHLFNFPVRLILALHNYDITIHEQDKQTALQQINEVCNDFQTMRNNWKRPIHRPVLWNNLTVTLLTKTTTTILPPKPTTATGGIIMKFQ